MLLFDLKKLRQIYKIYVLFFFRNQTVKGELEGPEDKVLEMKKWLQVLVFIILIYQSFFGFEYDRCPKYDINIFKFTLLREAL